MFIQRARKQDSFTGRLFRSFLSLILMFMGLTGITISLISMYVLRSNTIRDNQLLLTQFGNSVNTVFTYVDNMTSHFIANQKIRDFLAYYEKKDIEVMSDVSTQFQNFMISIDSIHSILIYYPQKDMVYMANTGFLPTQDFYDRDFLENLNMADISSLWNTPRTIRDTSGRSATLFSIIKPLKYSGSALEAVLIVNLDASLFTEVFNSISTNKQAYLAMNHQGILVAWSQNGLPYIQAGNDIFNALPGTGSRELTLGQDRLLISCIDSPDTGWKFYSLVHTDILYQEIHTLLLFSAGSLVAGFLIAVFFSRMTTRRLSAPLAAIARQLSGKAPAERASRSEGDVLKHIERGITRLQAENETIQQSLEKSQPILRNNFLVSLLGGIITDTDEIDRNLSYFDINLPSNVPVCAILVRINEYDTLSGEKYQPKQLHSFSTYLANLLETVFPNTKDCLICSSFENEIAVICTLEDKKTAHDMGRKIEELFEAEKKHIESIAIGSMEASLYKIHASCANARRALALGLWSDGLLISYEDILLHSSESAKYPYDLEADLISALKNRNPQEADQCLKNMLHFILPQTKNDKISRTYLLAQLYGALIKYARESGLTGGFAEEPSHYAELLSLSGEGILLWFHGLMENILAQIAYRKANSEQLLSGRIKKYLEENYQKDISIPELSEIFLYSPTHLSRIFHSETGSSIKQYLTKIRMEKACELLGDYSLKISEVGELTGYPRVHGFLKQFKNFTGQTPSEYREYLSAKKTGQKPGKPDS